MARLKKFPSSVLLVLTVATLINNLALTSPQARAKGPPNLKSVPETSFSCHGRTAGYYADTEAHCQAYHMCDTLEQQYSYLCPGYTLFNQKFMVCDHWHAVNCSIAEQFYDLNKKIGQVPGKESATEEDNVIKNRSSNQNQQKLSAVFKFNVFRGTTAATTTTKPKIFPRPQPITRPRKKSPRPVVTTSFTTTSRPVTVKPALRHFPKVTSFTPRIFVTTEPPSFHKPTTSRSTFNFSPALRKAKTKGVFLSPRGPLKFKFGPGSGLKESKSRSDEEIFKIKFPAKKTFFDKRNFTVSPNVFRPTTPSSSDDEGDDDETEDKAGKQHFNSPIVPFLVPPLIESPSLPPPTPRAFLVPPSRPPPSIFLVPPARGPVIIEGENQEILTPLVVSNQFFKSKPLHLHIPQSRITPPRFSSRSNRDFYIPSSGIIQPIGDNSLSDEEDGGHSPVHHKMTMTFPNRTSIRRRRPLKLNPRCPRCHPAFLRPNQCQPCVIIK